MKIIVASGNEGKIAEIKEIIEALELDTELYSLKDVYGEVPEIPETADSFIGNSRLKAEWVRAKENCWVLADDSGLEVSALEGAPGVLSARYAGEECDNEKNIDKLLEDMKDIPEKERNAQFTCVIVLVSPEGVELAVEGVCKGKIATERAGEAGFGYDSVFLPKGQDGTFAELDSTMKNKLSHRGRAIQDLALSMHDLFG